MTIGSLAKAAEINVETIRYYQRLGLMTEPKKPLGGIRRYDDVALARLRFIRGHDGWDSVWRKSENC
jgi:MerR family mercuric resistance operon transcriptional regulator